MSHFVVLVIGDDVDEQLAPYHEFESTGLDDQYVVEVDETESLLKEFREESVEAIETPDGARYAKYDDRFYRDPTPEEISKISHDGKRIYGTGTRDGISYASRDWGDGKGHRGKIHEIPADCKVVEVRHSDVRTFEEYIEYCWGSVNKLRPGQEMTEEHRYSFVEVDELGAITRAVRRTNPNAKWDWYVIGGRWTGYFPLKDGAKGNVGRPGLMTDPARPGHADIARKGDIDFESAREKAQREAERRFDKWERIFLEHGKPLPWSHFYNKSIDGRLNYNRGDARDEYNDQPAISEAKSKLGLWGCPVDDIGFDREGYISRCRNAALIPFAIVKDGKWIQKGDMGWWGAVSNEKDQSKWNEEVARLIDDLPDDTMFTIVDCHI